MARKYTILKVLIQNLNKGFTLIELIFGLLIMLIVGGLAMNALVEASKTASNDKRNIDSSQNLSAVLEIIGNDIKQAGENINDGNFPVISIAPNTDVTVPAPMTGSSKITIRRAFTSPLNLCEPVAAAATVTSLIVANNSLTGTNPNCSTAGSLTHSQVLLAGATTPTALAPTITRPTTLMSARDKRCQVDDININYDNFPKTTDYCLTPANPAREKVRAAMYEAGNLWAFDYTNDDQTTTGTPTPAANTKFQISIANPSPATPTVAYPYDKPIYLIEERIYTLDINGNLKVQRDGASFANAETLISGMKTFNVSARVYADKTTKTSDAIDGTVADMPTTRRCVSTIPNYICAFKSSAFPNDDWKKLQGIKVELQTRYDPTGRGTEAEAIVKTPQEIEKLKATAEFFPRNVLSK